MHNWIKGIFMQLNLYLWLLITIYYVFLRYNAILSQHNNRDIEQQESMIYCQLASRYPNFIWRILSSFLP